MKLPFERSWWIEPGKIIGGRYPGTKAPAEARQMLDALLALGVRVIINLQEPDERGHGGSPFPDYCPTVAELAQARGVEVACHRFAIRDMNLPTRETMTQIQKVLREAVDAGHLAYVHCWGGHGRTGTVAGCWLVDQGASPKDAMQMMKDSRRHDPHLAKESAPQTAEQRAMIEAWHTARR